MDKTKFGTYIKEKRLETGLTQKEFADKLMIGVTAVSKWERGVTYPDITMIPDICRYLGVSEHELIESSNDIEYRDTMKQADNYKRLKDVIFYSFTFAYIAASVVCFIVNLAVDKTLSWFWLVFASCICAYSFVPSYMRFFKPKNRLLAFMSTSIFGLVTLFLTCCIYSGGKWFFVAVSSVILGYFTIFSPLLFYKQKKYLTEQEYKKISKWFMLIYSVGLYLLTLLVLFIVSCYVGFDFILPLKISSYCFTILIAFGIIELFHIKRVQKIGIGFLLSGLYLYGINGVLNSLIPNGKTDCYHIDFSNFGRYSNGNVAIIILVLFSVIGIGLIIKGFLNKKSV